MRFFTATKVRKDGKTSIIIFGGIRYVKNSGYILNMGNMELNELGDLGYKGCGQTANLKDNGIYLFAGIHDNECVNDLHRYDI